MLGTQDLPAFVAAGVVLNLTPGPDTLYIITRTLAQGRRAGILSALGISAGCLVHITFAAFGLSAILTASAAAFTAVKYAGAAYLIYLGVQALRRKSVPLTDTPALLPGTDRAVFRQGMLTNLLNPKVAIFFLAFLPQFVVPGAGWGPLPFLFLGLLFLTTGTTWCLALVGLATVAARALRSNRRVAAVLEKASGVVFIALGLHLLRARPQPA